MSVCISNHLLCCMCVTNIFGWLWLHQPHHQEFAGLKKSDSISPTIWRDEYFLSAVHSSKNTCLHSRREAIFFFSFNLFNRSVNHWPLLTASQLTLNCVVSNTLCCEMSGAVLQVKLCIPRPFNRSASTVCKWKAVYLSCPTAFHSNIIGHGSHQHLTMELWQ